MSEAAYASSATIDRTDAVPFEVGTVQWVRRPGDGNRSELSAGYWFITPEQTPGPMTITGHADETVHILEGHVTVAVENGPTLDLRAGSSASLNRGTVATWTVLEPTVEFFVYS
ncbi:cupin domain-containing protein [Herbiconiux sp.]|uniref:cupin domain-containing protein n=1 Tax=Herbiconiux sp. TaxID=1871186 RepID=UPI0025BC9555|nr:cupin domain-containing protein [Herbiconiux sp.]